MPHRNRVDPWGRLIETAARGDWYGNRGCLHDRNGCITGRKPPVDAWIICVLEFKGRRRTLLQPGRFTELFFLDEATALAAGHRPCGECRYADLRRFGRAWPGAAPGRYVLARDMDAVMRVERVVPVRQRRRRWLDPERPPADGLMFMRAEDAAETALISVRGALWRWTPRGYEGPVPWSGRERAVLLTPPSTAAAIANGYRPQIHRSAAG